MIEFRLSDPAAIFKDGARLVAGRKQNPPGGPRISAPPSPRPDRSEASWVNYDALRHLSEFLDLFDICRSCGICLTGDGWQRNRRAAQPCAFAQFCSIRVGRRELS